MRLASALRASVMSDISASFSPLASFFVESLRDESTYLLVLRERERAAVALLRLVASAESTEHVGASEVKGRVPLQGACGPCLRQELQTFGRCHREGDGDGAIQLDDGRALVAKKLLVEDGDLPPVRLCGLRCFGVHRRNRTLDLVRPWTPHAERLFDEPKALFDVRAFPAGAILVLEQHQFAGVTGTRLAPRIVEQHERKQAEGFRLVG